MHGILSIIKTIPQANTILGNMTSLLTKTLAAIPLWGKILAGVIIGSLAAATLYAESFKVKGICGYP